jgi:cytochrome b pre-mRNA-processing protein 3
MASSSATTTASTSALSTPPPSKPAALEAPPNFISRYLMQNPRAMRAFIKMTNLFGYGSPRQLAARRALVLYERLCAGRPEEEMDFWRNGTLVSDLRLAPMLIRSPTQTATFRRPSSPGSR